MRRNNTVTGARDNSNTVTVTVTVTDARNNSNTVAATATGGRGCARGFTAVGGITLRVLSELGHDLNAPGLVIARSWPELVGARAAQHSEALGLSDDGVLEVRVDSPAWSQHLQVRSADILAAVARLLPGRVPTRLRLRVGSGTLRE